MVGGLLCVTVFFFFSSRRRHTRSLRDWSSDVCSSDLGCSFTAARPLWPCGVYLLTLPNDTVSHVGPDRRGDLGVRRPAAAGRHTRGAGGRTVGAARTHPRSTRPALHSGPPARRYQPH